MHARNDDGGCEMAQRPYVHNNGETQHLFLQPLSVLRRPVFIFSLSPFFAQYTRARAYVVINALRTLCTYVTVTT